MDVRTPPENIDDAVTQLWYAMLGTNGSGVFTQVAELRKELKTFQDDFKKYQTTTVTKETCTAFQSKRDRKRERLREGFYIFIAVTGWAFGDSILTAIAKTFGG